MPNIGFNTTGDLTYETFCTTSLVNVPSTYGNESFNAPLKIMRGDRLERTFYVVQDGLPFDLTEYFVRMTAKYSKTDADVSAVFVLTSNPGGGISINSATGGVCSFTILPAHTSGLPGYKVNLFYDIQITSNNDLTLVYTVANGILSIVSDVSVTVP